jgi:hypothetical protein
MASIFALDICNMPSPLFAGLSAMMQNLPFVKHGVILNQKIFGPSGVIGRTILAGLAGGAP